MQNQKLGRMAESPYFCSRIIHSMSNQLKNVKLMKKAMLVMAMALLGAMQVSAQNSKVDDKEIIGTWVMESMQWEGEKKTMCNSFYI